MDLRSTVVVSFEGFSVEKTPHPAIGKWCYLIVKMNNDLFVYSRPTGEINDPI